VFDDDCFRVGRESKRSRDESWERHARAVPRPWPYGLPVSCNNRRMDVCSSYTWWVSYPGRWFCRSKTYGFRCRSKSVVGQFRFSYRTDVRRLVVVNVPLVCAVDVRAAVVWLPSLSKHRQLVGRVRVAGLMYSHNSSLTEVHLLLL